MRGGGVSLCMGGVGLGTEFESWSGCSPGLWRRGKCGQCGHGGRQGGGERAGKSGWGGAIEVGGGGKRLSTRQTREAFHPFCCANWCGASRRSVIGQNRLGRQGGQGLAGTTAPGVGTRSACCPRAHAVRGGGVDLPTQKRVDGHTPFRPRFDAPIFGELSASSFSDSLKQGPPSGER